MTFLLTRTIVRVTTDSACLGTLYTITTMDPTRQILQTGIDTRTKTQRQTETDVQIDRLVGGQRRIRKQLKEKINKAKDGQECRGMM